MADMFRRPNSGQASFRITAARLLLVLALVSSFSGCSSTLARTGALHDFHKVRSVGGIDEFRLQTNGLTILLVRDASAPVVSFNVTYRVGSRNEVTGTTGATHLLEHLMFKGSDQYNKSDGTSLDQYLERVGAGYNASTSLDRTNYYATLGRDHLDGYVAIEANRMRHLWLREEDRNVEMTVVRNEFERGKNDPGTLLWEEVMAATYQASSYHHPTIGWKSDIEQISIDKIRAFYDAYYWPNNATVIVAGDFETNDVLRTIEKYYGVYPRSPQPIPQVYTEEPEQSGPRRVTVKRPGQLGSLLIAHKVPDARNDDHAALTVLDGILSIGKSARLYRALVDTGLALGARSATFGLHDLSVHTLGVELAPGATHEQVEQALLMEIEKIKRDGVTIAEVDRVKRQTLVEEAYRRDGTAGVVDALSEYTAVGDWTLYQRLPAQISRVTTADVQRVAKNWLDEDQSTTGWYVPKPKNESDS